jgi:hypothetical protein
MLISGYYTIVMINLQMQNKYAKCWLTINLSKMLERIKLSMLIIYTSFVLKDQL